MRRVHVEQWQGWLVLFHVAACGCWRSSRLPKSRPAATRYQSQERWRHTLRRRTFSPPQASPARRCLPSRSTAATGCSAVLPRPLQMQIVEFSGAALRGRVQLDLAGTRPKVKGDSGWLIRPACNPRQRPPSFTGVPIPPRPPESHEFASQFLRFFLGCLGQENHHFPASQASSSRRRPFSLLLFSCDPSTCDHSELDRVRAPSSRGSRGPLCRTSFPLLQLPRFAATGRRRFRSRRSFSHRISDNNPILLLAIRPFYLFSLLQSKAARTAVSATQWHELALLSLSGQDYACDSACSCDLPGALHPLPTALPPLIPQTPLRRRSDPVEYISALSHGRRV